MSSLGLKGVGVSRGIAIGKVHLLQRNQLKVREYLLPASLIEAEVGRFNQALDAAREQLAAIRGKIPHNTPVDIVSFIDTHLLMMADKALAHEPIELIRRRGCNAEWALKLQRDTLVAVFEAMEDPYLRTRKDDVDHVVNRIQRLLLNQNDRVAEIGDGRLEGCIIIADDLAPADTVTLQHEGIVAFVTEYGGPTSHTTILARSLGIPAVVGVKNVLRYLSQGESLVVDGHHGVVISGCDKHCISHYRKRQVEERHYRSELNKLKELPAISRDGMTVALQANIELPEDMVALKRVGAKGVGLYRTEYLFMNRSELPDETEQLESYRKIVRALNGAPLTIRTLDLGADKALHPERRQESRGTVATNPALGLRAIRLCLRDPSLFKPQIRAILRVAAEGPVSMMIPMLASMQELHQALELIDEARDELRREGKPFDDTIAIGGMIEVPAAALCADAFARRLDFFSIGTNDLVQYTLAADRLDNSVNYLYQPTHPAVLKLISMTLKAGRKAGIPVSMCGEMAGEPRYTRLLLGLGLREFSMQPAMVPEVKRIVQESDVDGLTKKVQRVLNMPSAVEVEAFVEILNGATS
jgi:phosphotransferase system enzyme I (PtsI)